MTFKPILWLFAGAFLGPAALAAQLSGTSALAPDPYDLTADSADWVHFGFVPLPLDRKRGVSPQITDYESLGGADPGSTEKVETEFAWTDGLSPVQTITGTSTGKRVFQIGRGFRFRVPARTSKRTLRVYVGAWQAVGRLTARLSDGSAAQYTTTVSNNPGYGGRVVTLSYRAASNQAELIVDYVVTQHFAGQNFITLESAALSASGGGGGAMLTGSTATSPGSINLSATGTLDWVHWGRISDQPLDRKQGVAAQISDHSTVGLDVSPSPGAAGSAARWSDGFPNPAVSGTRSSIRVFDRNKGMKVTVPAGRNRQTVLAYVGLKGKARAQFKAVLSDGSRPAFSQTLSQSSGQQTWVFSLDFAAASDDRLLTLSITRTDARTSASYVSLESVKLLGSSAPNPGPAPQPQPGTGALGDLVFLDANGNGLQDSGETGLAGVTVRLRACAGTEDLAVRTTNGNGNYLFENLADERFRMSVDAPQGYEFSPRRVGSNRSKDSDVFADGKMSCTRARPGRVKNQFDAGLVATEGTPDPVDPPPPGDGVVGGGTAKLGDRVWRDDNNNGIQDPAEPGVVGVTVHLLTCTGNTEVASTTTSASGLYRFSEVPDGRYRLRFVAPNGLSFSAQGAGNDTLLDSDAQANGTTRCVRLRAGAGRFGYDAGLN